MDVDDEYLFLTTSTAHLKGPLDSRSRWRDLALDWIAAKAMRTAGMTASHLALATSMSFGPMKDLDIYKLILSMHFTPGIGRSHYYHYWSQLSWPDEESKDIEAGKWAEEEEGNEVGVTNRTEGRKAKDERLKLLEERILDRDNKLLTAYDFIYSEAVAEAADELIYRASETSSKKDPVEREVELLLGKQPNDWIDRLTLVQQMESIGLFQEAAKLEESAIALFRPEERQQAWDFSEGARKSVETPLSRTLDSVRLLSIVGKI
ncbi:MAG: hypothetical protein Q9182_004137 [Xanthomendoza sp. 2 TL-2023]